ncbi:MAG: DUF2852 domain-containing protein [Devosiaceae bacterium]
MVLGFIIAWPLGLAMLAYIIWGDRMDDLKHDMRRGFGRFKREMDMKGFTAADRGMGRNTGNVAFDDFRKAEIDRLEAERRKLDEMVDEFDSHLRNLRRAKDQAEFDEFMKSRHNHNGDHPTTDGNTAPAT